MERIQLIQTTGIFLILIGVVALFLQSNSFGDENLVGDARMIDTQQPSLTETKVSYLSDNEQQFIQAVESDRRTADMSPEQRKELLDIQREIVRAVEHCPEIEQIARENEDLGLRAGEEVESRAQQAFADCEVLRPDIRELAETDQFIRGDEQIQKGFWSWISSIMTAIGCAGGNTGNCVSLAITIYNQMN